MCMQRYYLKHSLCLNCQWCSGDGLSTALQQLVVSAQRNVGCPVELVHEPLYAVSQGCFCITCHNNSQT